MSLLDKFKKKFERKEKKVVDKVKKTKKEDKLVNVKAEKVKSKEPKVEIKDVTGKASKVILRPLQTEKITNQMSIAKYSFEVADSTNKVEIRKAVKAIYNVDPIGINVINMCGKPTRFGRIYSKRKNWKKAIVTLKPGEKIEVFEGV